MLLVKGQDEKHPSLVFEAFVFRQVPSRKKYLAHFFTSDIVVDIYS